MTSEFSQISHVLSQHGRVVKCPCWIVQIQCWVNKWIQVRFTRMSISNSSLLVLKTNDSVSAHVCCKVTWLGWPQTYMNRITLASPTAVPSYAEQLLESKQFGLCGPRLDNCALEFNRGMDGWTLDLYWRSTSVSPSPLHSKQLVVSVTWKTRSNRST